MSDKPLLKKEIYAEEYYHKNIGKVLDYDVVVLHLKKFRDWMDKASNADNLFKKDRIDEETMLQYQLTLDVAFGVLETKFEEVFGDVK